MNSQEKLRKIYSIINSCETPDQLNSCKSFINNNNYFVQDSVSKTNIIIYLIEKAKDMNYIDFKI